MISNIYKNGGRYRPSKEFLRQQQEFKKKNAKPKKGFVYFVYCPHSDAVKIGFTSNVKNRIASLQTGSASELILIGSISTFPCYEKTLHKKHEQFHIRGEWFRATPEFFSKLRDTATLFKGTFYNDNVPVAMIKEWRLL